MTSFYPNYLKDTSPNTVTFFGGTGSQGFNIGILEAGRTQFSPNQKKAVALRGRELLRGEIAGGRGGRGLERGTRGPP